MLMIPPLAPNSFWNDMDGDDGDGLTAVPTLANLSSLQPQDDDYSVLDDLYFRRHNESGSSAFAAS